MQALSREFEYENKYAKKAKVEYNQRGRVGIFAR